MGGIVCWLSGHGVDAWLRLIDWPGAPEHLDPIRIAACSKWSPVEIHVEIE